jgi:glucose-6-phosphate isomerase
VEAVDTDTKKPIAKAKDRRMRFMVRGVQPRFSVLSNVNRISKSRE